MTAPGHNMAKVDKAPHWSKVLADMKQGKTKSLARHLNGSLGQIDPCISAYLIDLIEGSVSKTGQRLKLVRHPDLARKEQGREARLSRYARDHRIMRFIAFQYHCKGLDYKNSVFNASQKFRLSEASIEKIFGKFSARQKASWINMYTRMGKERRNPT